MNSNDWSSEISTFCCRKQAGFPNLRNFYGGDLLHNRVRLEWHFWHDDDAEIPIFEGAMSIPTHINGKFELCAGVRCEREFEKLW